MKTYKRSRTRQEVLKMCKAQGLVVNSILYDKFESDYIVIEGGGAKVLWRPFDGEFFGTTPSNVKFRSAGKVHENEPWFKALLDFFYTNEPEQPLIVGPEAWALLK